MNKRDTKTNHPGKYNRLHKLQAQEGKPKRGRTRQKMLEGKDAEVYACQEKDRQHGRERVGERQDKDGRRKEWQGEQSMHQLDYKQE